MDNIVKLRYVVVIEHKGCVLYYKTLKDGKNHVVTDNEDEAHRFKSRRAAEKLGGRAASCLHAEKYSIKTSA